MSEQQPAAIPEQAPAEEQARETAPDTAANRKLLESKFGANMLHGWSDDRINGYVEIMNSDPNAKKAFNKWNNKWDNDQDSSARGEAQTPAADAPEQAPVQTPEQTADRADTAPAERQAVYAAANQDIQARVAGEIEAAKESQVPGVTGTGVLAKFKPSNIGARYWQWTLDRSAKNARKSEKRALELKKRPEESEKAYAKRLRRNKLAFDASVAAGVGLGAVVLVGTKGFGLLNNALDDAALNGSTGGNFDSGSDNNRIRGGEEYPSLMASHDGLDSFIPNSHENPAMWPGKDHPNDFGPALESRPEFDNNFPGETDSYWRMRDNGHQAALAFAEAHIPGAPVESDYPSKAAYIDAVNRYGEDLNHDKQKYSDVYEAYMDKLYNPAHPASYEMVTIDFPYESSYMEKGDPNIVGWDDNANHGGTAVKITMHDGTVIWRRLDCDNIIKPLPKPVFVDNYVPQGNGTYTETGYTTPTGSGPNPHTPTGGGPETPPPSGPPPTGPPPTGPPPTGPPPTGPPSDNKDWNKQVDTEMTPQGIGPATGNPAIVGNGTVSPEITGSEKHDAPAIGAKTDGAVTGTGGGRTPETGNNGGGAAAADLGQSSESATGKATKATGDATGSTNAPAQGRVE